MADVTASQTVQTDAPTTVRERPQGLGPLSLVHPCGEIDLRSAPALGDALAVLVQRGGAIGVDLGAVRFMDAAGLRVLCAAANSLGDHGSLALLHPNQQVFRLLMITGLTDLVANAEGAGTSLSAHGEAASPAPLV